MFVAPDEYQPTPAERLLIQRKVRQMIQRSGIPAGEQDDLEQELLIALVLGHRKYLPERSEWAVFVRKLIDHAVARILRYARASKRNRRGEVSLNERVRMGYDSDVERADLISQEQRTAHRPYFPRSDQELSDLRLDQAFLLDDLPPEIQRLLREAANSSVSGIARQTGIPRTTLRDWLSQAARAIRHKAGLDF